MNKSKSLIRLIQIPKIVDDCFLFFAQTSTHIPFPIRRIFFITKVNTKLPRGKHAHKTTDHVLFCLQGNVRITLDNGKKREEVLLNKPNLGIFLDKMIWHEMRDFKSNTILLALASKQFDPKDYIRNYEFFIKSVKA